MSGAPGCSVARLRDALLVAAGVVLAGTQCASAVERAAHVDVFLSDDADDTTVSKVGIGGDLRFVDIENYDGIRLEALRIRPTGGTRWDDQRAYYAFARAGDGWKWAGRIGSDGDTVLGNASAVREGPVRQEYFVEREILETPRGIEGLYYTFAGATVDVPLDDAGRHQFTTLAGAQAFTGDNMRSHLRARYIAVLNPDWGLSLQLRARAFHNSDPFEFDYYSPRWFGEAMSVVQLRRFHRRWMYSAALGWGRQRDSESAWRDARLAEASVTSPRSGDQAYLRVSASYTNTPTGTGASYGYRQLTLQWIKPF